MNPALMLDKCGEFPAASAILGVGEGVAMERGQLFIVPPYRAPIVDRRIARRMASLCRFHASAA